MQDDQATAHDEAAPAELAGAPPSIGQSLRSAREARDLSTEAAAAALHLDAGMLHALEADEYHRLGAAVFVRGHLRRYAALVSMDAEALLLQYQRMAPAEGLPSRPAGSGERFAVDDGLNWRLVLIIVLVMLIVAFAVWRLWGPNAEPTTMATDLSQINAAAPQASRPALSMLNLPDLSRTPDSSITSEALAVVTLPGAETSASVTAVSATPSASVSQPAGSPGNGESLGLPLVVSCSSECWTQLTDAVGRRLFVGLAQPGQRIAVRGEAPIAVVLGNAGAAELEVDGRAYPISRESINNNVARLTIEAPR
jgi:cytoskeleton protein RodZ